jgi:ABC-2 type transport system permease protein
MADSTVSADWATMRAVGGTALYLAAVALTGLGAGLAVRETAWATVGILTLLHVAPITLRFVSDPDLRERLQHLSPSAGFLMQATRDLDALPMPPWLGLSVTAAWAGAAMLGGAGLLHARDL